MGSGSGRRLRLRLRRRFLRAPNGSGSTTAASSSARIASSPPIRPSAQAAWPRIKRLGVGQQADQGRHERRVAGIARGDTRVAHQAAALGAQHRRPAKPGAKAGVVQGQQLGQRDNYADCLRQPGRTPKVLTATCLLYGHTSWHTSQPKTQSPSKTAVRAGSGRATRWSGTRCSVGRPARAVRQKPGSGRRPDSVCSGHSRDPMPDG